MSYLSYDMYYYCDIVRCIGDMYVRQASGGLEGLLAETCPLLG